MAHNYSKVYVLKCQGVDCKQSIISLNIRRVLRHGVFGKENTLSQKGSGLLAACAFYPSYFEENKRLLAVYQSVGHKTVKEVCNFGSVEVWLWKVGILLLGPNGGSMTLKFSDQG